MNTKEIITIALSSGIVASLVSSFVNYFFDKSKDKAKQSFEIKQSAYMKAITAISGAADNVMNFILQGSSVKNLNGLSILNYLTNLQKEIAPAFLVANDEIQKLLKKMAPLIKDGTALFEEILADVKPIQGGFRAGNNPALVARLKKWSKDMESLENQIILAVQKDLGLR